MASLQISSLKNQQNDKYKESNKQPSIEMILPNEYLHEKKFNLIMDVSSSNSSEEHLLVVEQEHIGSTIQIFLSKDLKVPFSSPLLEEEQYLLDKEFLNQILYRKEQQDKLTIKEQKGKNLMQKLRIKISWRNKIKSSDLKKIRQYSIPLGRQDQLLRLCNDFNFYSDNVQFYPKSTLVKCDKSENSFEADSIHISSSFSVIDQNNISQKRQNITEKIKKTSLLMLMLGENFKIKLKELIALTEEQMNGDIDPKIQSIQEEFFKRVESFCKQSNKIKI